MTTRRSRSFNIVPTAATRKLAAAMITDARKTTGGDAALKHLPDLHPEQLAAFIGALLTQIKIVEHQRGHLLPLELEAEERRRCHAAFARGERTPEVVAGEREYQRVDKRMRRRHLKLGSAG
jgi:hypothetical protein